MALNLDKPIRTTSSSRFDLDAPFGQGVVELQPAPNPVQAFFDRLALTLIRTGPFAGERPERIRELVPGSREAEQRVASARGLSRVGTVVGEITGELPTFAILGPLAKFGRFARPGLGLFSRRVPLSAAETSGLSAGTELLAGEPKNIPERAVGGAVVGATLPVAGAGILSTVARSRGTTLPVIERAIASRGRPLLSGAPSPTELTPGPATLTPQPTRVQKVTDALTSAKPIRESQEALFTAERGRRLGAMLGVRQRVGGEAGFRAELATLKGELPKRQFESIRSKLTQPDIDGLFDDINSSALGPWEQLNAKEGLAKLLGAEGGRVPTRGELALLRQVFGPELVEAALAQRPLIQKLAEEGIELINLPRALMASFDLSAPLRQGLFLIGRPNQWLPAFGNMFRQFGSEKTFQAAQDAIRKRATFPLMQRARLSLTDIGEEITEREEKFMSRMAERIPILSAGVKASNRGYVGFLNKLRADTFDDLVKKGRALGVPEDDPHFLSSIASYVNAATGRGNLGQFERASVILNSFFFSPRLMASRLNLLNPIFYAKLHPVVRQRALTDALTMTSAGLSVLGLSKLNGSEVGTDPRSADFGKIKIGNTRFDIWGGFQQIVVGLSKLLTGESVSTTTGRITELSGEGFKTPTRSDIIIRFLQSKEHPVLSLVATLFRGRTIFGDPIDVSAEIADRFIPMFIADLFEVSREHGVSRGWMALPGAFGVGVQTYGRLLPLLERTPTGRLKVGFRQFPSLGEFALNKLRGKPDSNIPRRFRAILESARQTEIQRKIDIEEAKQRALETGQTQTTGNTVIFFDQEGVLQTKTKGQVATPERVFEQLLSR